MEPKKVGVTRRQFVKGAAALSGAALFAGCSNDANSIVSNVTLDQDNKTPTTGTPNVGAAGDMPMFTLGKTGVKISALCFGGGTYFVSNTPAVQETMIKKAFDLGINYFDTSYDYGSEDMFGKVFTQSLYPRNKIMIGSKFDARDLTGANTYLTQSLTKMKTDYLDFLFAHNIGGQSTDNIDQIGSVLWPWMKQQKQAGKVRFIGFSSMSSHAKSKEFLEKLDPDVCILALSPYDAAKRYLGYYDAGFVTNALPVAASKNVGVIAMKSIRYIANIAKPLATPTECLAYVLNTLKGVHSVVVGMVGEPQVVNNVGLIKDVVGTGIKVDEHAFLKRLAPYANEKHVLWMRPDYKDNGQPNGGLFC